MTSSPVTESDAGRSGKRRQHASDESGCPDGSESRRKRRDEETRGGEAQVPLDLNDSQCPSSSLSTRLSSRSYLVERERSCYAYVDKSLTSPLLLFSCSQGRVGGSSTV